VTATAADGGAWRRGVTATGGGDERMGCRRAGGTTRPMEEWGRRGDGKGGDARPDTWWWVRAFSFRCGGAEA